MELSGINERTERINKRIEKEYVFDEAGGVVIDMKADSVWTIEVIAQLEADNKKAYKALKSISRFYVNRHGMVGGGAVEIAKQALGDNDGG